MKKLMTVMFLLFFTNTIFAMGNSQNQDNSQNSASLEQAKKDYAVFLQKLNEMGQQYGQVTGQVKQIVKEQGVPVWDDHEGRFKISHDINFTGDGPFSLTDREIKYVFEKPGLRKGSIRVLIEDDKILHVMALKKAQDRWAADEPIDEKYELPEVASDSSPHAKYEDGILTITIKRSLVPKKTVDVPVQ